MIKLNKVIPKENYHKYGPNLGNLLGERAEQRVKGVLSFLKEKGVIRDFIHAPKNSQLDHIQVDFIVVCFPKIYLLQVKSSPRVDSKVKRNLQARGIKLIIGNKEDKRLIKELYKLVS